MKVLSAVLCALAAYNAPSPSAYTLRRSGAVNPSSESTQLSLSELNDQQCRVMDPNMKNSTRATIAGGDAAETGLLSVDFAVSGSGVVTTPTGKTAGGTEHKNAACAKCKLDTGYVKCNGNAQKTGSRLEAVKKACDAEITKLTTSQTTLCAAVNATGISNAAKAAATTKCNAAKAALTSANTNKSKCDLGTSTGTTAIEKVGKKVFDNFYCGSMYCVRGVKPIPAGMPNNGTMEFMTTCSHAATSPYLAAKDAAGAKLYEKCT